jgi:hypothetical protein
MNNAQEVLQRVGTRPFGRIRHGLGCLLLRGIQRLVGGVEQALCQAPQCVGQMDGTSIAQRPRRIDVRAQELFGSIQSPDQFFFSRRSVRPDSVHRMLNVSTQGAFRPAPEATV